MSVTVSGTEVILADLERMIPTDTNVDEALKAGGEIIAAKMIELAPERTGRLKGAIKVGNSRGGKRGRTITVGVHRRDFGAGDYYPAFVEYGHGGPRPAPPHPYIRPAYDMTKDQAWAAIKQAVIEQMKGL